MNIEINKNQSVEEMSSQLPDGITWFFIGQPKTWKTSAASKSLFPSISKTKPKKNPHR